VWDEKGAVGGALPLIDFPEPLFQLTRVLLLKFHSCFAAKKHLSMPSEDFLEHYRTHRAPDALWGDDGYNQRVIEFRAKQKDVTTHFGLTVEYLENFLCNILPISDFSNPGRRPLCPLPSPDDPNWMAVPDPTGGHIDENGIAYQVVLRDKPGKKKRDVEYHLFLFTNAMRYACQYVYFKTEGDEIEKARVDDLVLFSFDAWRHTVSNETYERTIQLGEPTLLYDNDEDGDTGLTSTVYRSLPPGKGNIRLLILLPAQEKSAELSCILCAASLNKLPDYEALSYTWGDPKDTSPILLNGQVFHATKTLVSGLRHLRHKEAGKVRVLWVDAVCINQTDIMEKNHQVQQMAQIYKVAKSVIVWLGPETNTTHGAVSFILEAVQRSNEKHSNFNPDWIADLIKDESQTSVFAALKNFFSRPWFKRVWVVQEVALAKEIIVC
jgi:hypothetical protein